MTGTWSQLRALVGLRWTMVRSRPARLGLLALAGVVPLILAAAVAGGRLLPQQQAFDAAVVAPTALLVFAALAIVGPLTAGGGNELFPADQLVPHPVRPATVFVSSLLLAPLNIAWVGQTAALMTLTAYVVPTADGLPAALAVAVVFVLTATTVGQTLAWAAAGARQSAVGRRVLWSVVALLGVGAVVVVHVGLTDVLDRAPTRDV